MGKQDVANVIGRALLDSKFAAEVHQDPAQAAKSINANLSPAEVQSLKEVSASHLKAVSGSLKSGLSESAFFDQSQQQQQARMD